VNSDAAEAGLTLELRLGGRGMEAAVKGTTESNLREPDELREDNDVDGKEDCGLRGASRGWTTNGSRIVSCDKRRWGDGDLSDAQGLSAMSN